MERRRESAIKDLFGSFLVYVLLKFNYHLVKLFARLFTCHCSVMVVVCNFFFPLRCMVRREHNIARRGLRKFNHLRNSIFESISNKIGLKGRPVSISFKSTFAILVKFAFAGL